jgi:hypothetical protein
MANCKNNVVKLVQENTQLHNELKNVTIHEILNEFQNQQINVIILLKFRISYYSQRNYLCR